LNFDLESCFSILDAGNSKTTHQKLISNRVSKNCAKLVLSELHQMFTNFDNFLAKG